VLLLATIQPAGEWLMLQAQEREPGYQVTSNLTIL
jgi:hypothetical protein